MVKLVATTGGCSGSPEKCSGCGGNHFGRSSVAWHCADCGRYYPTELGFESLKEKLERAQSLMNDFKLAREDLEKIIKQP